MRDCSIFNQGNLSLITLHLMVHQTIGIDTNDFDTNEIDTKVVSFFLGRFNSIVDLHLPYNTLLKYKPKIRDKP